MKELQLDELQMDELQEINGGWNWHNAIGGAITGAVGTGLDPLGIIAGGILGGLS